MKIVFYIFIIINLLTRCGHCADSLPALARLSDYPYAVYMSVPYVNDHFVALAVSKHYIIGSLWWTETEYADDFYVYKHNPLLSQRILWVAKGDYRNVVVFKVCGELEAAGMALAPSKFFDFATDTPATLIFFAPDQSLYYVNTTALSDTNCPDAMAGTSAGYSYDPAEETCTQPDPTPGSCNWFTDGAESFRAAPVMVVNGQPVAVMTLAACDFSASPPTWDGGSVYNKILPNRDFILEFTDNQVDSP